MKKKWLYPLLKQNKVKTRCQYTGVGFWFEVMEIHYNITAATTNQNMTVQVLTIHFRSIQWLQIQFGDQKNHVMNLLMCLAPVFTPESIRLAKGFFPQGDKTAKITANNTIPSIIMRSSFFCIIKTCLPITKLYHQMTKKSKIRYINVTKQRKISKMDKNNRKIKHEKYGKYCNFVDDIVKLCYFYNIGIKICF